ncbi:sterile alpha motif domain-containing protein 9 isoform X2 [Gadus morhua]|uniref:sterile alpha motif domain-containing protein 9 isoform X2 n=1 Tax=Gadus morhua TaxID=8049 RepID=UPI0011B63814|nr:sterile alpha motif domain-containing protein 9-like isoform X2 [Gadus morhua]
MDDEPDERAGSPSCLSLKSDRSMPEPVNFKCQETVPLQDCTGMNTTEDGKAESLKSNDSMDIPPNVQQDHGREEEWQSRNLSPDKLQSNVRGAEGNPKALDGLPQHMEDWTKEHVKEWLTFLKVQQKIVICLYEQELSGSCLVCYEKKDLFDLGVSPAPAIQILRQVKMFRSQTDMIHVHGPKHHSPVMQKARNGQSAALDSNEDVETVFSDSGFSSQSPSMRLVEEHIELDQSRGAGQTMDNKTIFQDMIGNSSKNSATGSNLVTRICPTRPFDNIDQSFFYKENDELPPEMAPGNLLDPVHEYHMLPSVKELSEKEVLHEFIQGVFIFAAGCMNSRTNGTIHFGVKKQPGKACGQVIGQQIISDSKLMEKFELCLNEYFEEEHLNVARTCIRPPQFSQILGHDGTSLNKWVIEVDVIPSYSITQENVFYTSLKTASAGEETHQCKTQCLFVREGPVAINILADPNPRVTQEKIRSITDKVKVWALARKSAEERNKRPPSQGHQGQKLKRLIMCGRDTFDDFQLIVVTDKCPSNQLENLTFLKEMDPFAVLEFDPESDINGTCSFYRKDCIDNLHYPSMYTTGESNSSVIGKLNLFKQTSWVFCNGRVNEESMANKPLEPRDWLKKRCREINNMISFLCNPDLFSKDGLLVFFILHSAVTDISSPIMEAFCAIYRTLEGSDHMLCLCKDFDVFKQWRQLIETRCKVDITNKCIHELSLNEVNCTIHKLKGPHTLSVERYLPSTGSSSVILSRKEEEMMTVLDILSENECENTEIETAETFGEFKRKTEENFYRGGRVTWWDFYLSERPGCLPFIKRDKYKDLYELITFPESSTSPCVMVNLFHHPGCGGTTLAMHVLWNLRNKFRCAVVNNSMALNNEVAVQVKKLLTCGNQDQSAYTPVLLLVDNWNDIGDLKQSMLNVLERNPQNTPKIIVLNCERSQFPRECSRKSYFGNVFITNKLSVKEQSLFSEKLKQLKDHHMKPETFYAFMIMTKNFSETYITNLVNNTLKDLDKASKKGRLISFLALLNTYVDGSYMSLSLCKELVGIQSEFWKKETLENEMNPYFTLLINFTVEEHGTYKAVRFLHWMIARSCLDHFTQEHTLSHGEIIIDMLHCDLLYKTMMGKDLLVQNIQSMLLKRNRKEEGDDKDTLFSPLIEHIYKDEITDKVKEVLERATLRFEKSATLPQALARHFYLKAKDFTLSLQWAKDALSKKSNSYIADTLGQVYKSQLKEESSHLEDLSPEVLDKSLKLASKAIDAFRHSQDLAEREETVEREESVDPNDPLYRKRQRTYNMSGYNGESEVILNVLQVIQGLPLSTISERHKKDVILQMLKGNLQMSSFQNSETNANFIAVLRDHDKFLVSLQPRLKAIFCVFEEYFTYMKPRSMERESLDSRNKSKVFECFRKYIQIFCPSSEEKRKEKSSKPKISLGQEVVDQRLYLESKRADTFAGILQILYDKNGIEMEKILEKWQFIFYNEECKSSTSDMVNFILANIVLHNIKPTSKLLKKHEELVYHVKKALQIEGTNSNRTELYYLPMLLMWPTRGSTPFDLATYQNISAYVTSAKRSYQRRFSHMMQARSAIAHFFLGKSTGLKQIVSKRKLDEIVTSKQHPPLSGKTCKAHYLWQSGVVWKDPDVQKMLLRVKGKSESRGIYVHYPGNVKIPVRPVYLGDIRSGGSQEIVSFYLGFSMEGPVAYDIKYENDP